MCRRGPLTCADDGQSGAGTDEGQAGARAGAPTRAGEMLTASRARGVIGGRAIDAQHPDDRGQDALGLTQRSVEEETERQGGFDGEIGILEWPAPPADARRCPRGDRVGREPEGDGASPHEGSVVLGPVPDAIRCRVRRMHARRHIEIMTRRRSRWSTCRPRLAHRAESAHQRPIAAWKPEGTRTRGAPPKYSDLAIETALTLRLLFHLPLRQAEGFLPSLFHLMGLDLRSPDHTTLSRRGQHLNLTLRRVPRRAARHLFIDSTGLSMVGEGEWAAAKHGRRGRRGWKKLHLGVDQAGVIVAQALTDAAVDDASTGIDLIETIASSARTVTADAAYDTLAFYETANTRGTTVVVPPAKTAKLSQRNPRSSARDGTIRKISRIGRRRWKKEVGYHRQARVENAFFRYKSILGDRLRSRTRAAQAVESVRACNVLNRMTELGRPESFAIDR